MLLDVKQCQIVIKFPKCFPLVSELVFHGLFTGIYESIWTVNLYLSSTDLQYGLFFSLNVLVYIFQLLDSDFYIYQFDETDYYSYLLY